jgi:DNA-binding transcriptional MerR regulator
MNKGVVDVFEISDIAGILGMKPNTVKNWTIGRPIIVKPSIRTAMGHGKSNLYSVEDVYRFALANELHKVGMSPKRIAEVLDKLPEDLSKIQWIRIWRKKKELKLRMDRDDPPEDVKVWQTIKLSAIIQEVDQRISDPKLRPGEGQ